MLETKDVVLSLGPDDPLEEEMAIYSGILAWRIPRTEEPGGLQSIGLHTVGQDLSDSAAANKTPISFILFKCSFCRHAVGNTCKKIFLGLFLMVPGLPDPLPHLPKRITEKGKSSR